MKIVKQISEEGLAFQRKLAELNSQVSIAMNNRNNYTNSCTHELAELTESDLNDTWMSVGAHCLICGTFWGWRCKSSPDSVCHYYSSKGKVRMIDGTEVDVPNGHNQKRENDDECIFCGHPDERK